MCKYDKLTYACGCALRFKYIGPYCEDAKARAREFNLKKPVPCSPEKDRWVVGDPTKRCKVCGKVAKMTFAVAEDTKKALKAVGHVVVKQGVDYVRRGGQLDWDATRAERAEATARAKEWGAKRAEQHFGESSRRTAHR